MKSISEARELRKRIAKAHDCITAANDNDDSLFISTQELREIMGMIMQVLGLTYAKVDAMIEEWDAERGIDRPL